MAEWKQCKICGDEFQTEKGVEKCKNRHESAKIFLEGEISGDAGEIQEEGRLRILFFIKQKLGQRRTGRKRFSVPFTAKEMKALFRDLPSFSTRGQGLVIRLLGNEISQLDEIFGVGWDTFEGNNMNRTIGKAVGTQSYLFQMNWKPKKILNSELSLSFLSITFTTLRN